MMRRVSLFFMLRSHLLWSCRHGFANKYREGGLYSHGVRRAMCLHKVFADLALLFVARRFAWRSDSRGN